MIIKNQNVEFTYLNTIHIQYGKIIHETPCTSPFEVSSVMHLKFDRHCSTIVTYFEKISSVNVAVYDFSDSTTA